MKCKKCKLVEMKIKRVENEKVVHHCPKCNEEEITDIPKQEEIEKQDN